VVVKNLISKFKRDNSLRLESRGKARMDLTEDALVGLVQIVRSLSRRDLIYIYLEIKKIIS
jgi:hypothetical protein